VKCIFALIIVLIIFKHPKYTMRKNFVNGREAIEICLSEKGALAKKRLGNTGLKLPSIMMNNFTLFVQAYLARSCKDFWVTFFQKS